ncbi:hypothetical protein Fleli_1477 [Bernardetia litoralis DSM 6794]|uniref:Uncharacterized protein n=1 Tax=Bernardetia litoralis (strain ATCC 23117 / DSM 6794 / NBRC 15988 / NCIMB 1366 / Fx l1 / Sio-4) TaxID=880071 RepID=I4AIW7_BERLS|nr:hypothetical protein [Bernardetia litoralis]AFM03902.1 hypothetical protein Fleli_1477 [Bernardetia litoralis DSM 6794]
MGNINQELERLQLISDFLKGKFSVKQLEHFKKRLENDPVLAEELQKHKKLIELLKKKQERDIAFLLDTKKDVDYMKQERIYRRNQLRQELEKIKDQKTEQQENWERKVAQSNQPSIYKMAAVFSLAIAIGGGVFFVATQLIDSQKERALQAEVSVPMLVEVETNPNDVLDKTIDNSLFQNEEKQVVAQNENIEAVEIKNKNPQQSISKKQNLLAYQPIEEYENRLNQTTRSSINLKSPISVVENYTQNLIFEWSGISEEEIYLEIINSQKEIITYENLESPFVFDQQLEKGIYYWILQTDSEVIKRGKFLVK